MISENPYSDITTNWKSHEKVTQTYLAVFYFRALCYSVIALILPLHLPYTGSLDIQQLVRDCWLSSGRLSGLFTQTHAIISWRIPEASCRALHALCDATWLRSVAKSAIFSGVNCLDDIAGSFPATGSAGSFNQSFDQRADGGLGPVRGLQMRKPHQQP